MNLQYNLETLLTITAVVISALGSYFIIRLNWMRYGLLFIMAAVVGHILCYIYVHVCFYSFPYRLLPGLSVMPFETVMTVFPFLVLLGVRYSPQSWAYKIPFYWIIVHLGMTAETLAQLYTELIDYEFAWDFWDSYTWWWIYLLGFELIGGKLIPAHLRRPLSAESFRYGGWAWIALHVVVVITIFLGGLYLGYVLFHVGPSD